MMTTIDPSGWAVRRADGSIVVEIGPDVTEHRVWTIALGWPTVGEVKWEKQNGGRAFRCKLVEIQP
jgi:hypothetical protein